MRVGPVIVNNTPLVALWVLGRLDLMRELYDEVLIPQAVYDEFLATERAVRQTVLENSSWIRLVSLANPQRARVYIGLDRGEAEVLALAEERAARLVIIDELKGRRYAQRLEMPLTGTLGLLLLAPKTPTAFFILRETAGPGFWAFFKKLSLGSQRERIDR